MEFNQDVKNKSAWTDALFYSSVAILVATVFFYGIFLAKSYLENQKIVQLDKKIAVYGTSDQRKYEEEVFDYKKKIDDFAAIFSNHKISSNMLSFIERNTLPTVWFSSFDMSEAINEIRLLGEADSMETVSRQVAMFENSTDYIKNINILNSQLVTGGKVSFVLNLSLDPKIFSYDYPVIPIKPSVLVNPPPTS